MKTLYSLLALPLVAMTGCFIVPPPQPAPAPAAPAAPAAAAPAAPAPVADTPIVQPPFEDQPDPGTPADEGPGLAEGRPVGLKDGAAEGIWVWHDAAGWHLRTTTAKNSHRFRGVVGGAKGEVGNVRVVRAEQNDRFRKKNNRMFFDFQTKGHEDGFDFMIAESNCAIFNVTIDGMARTDRIKIGVNGVSPKHNAFKVCH